MKTQFQFIHFVRDADHLKHPSFVCRNNKTNDELGIVQWYQPWRQFCYFPTCPAVYSADCLADVKTFIGQLANGGNHAAL
jgi:hypothetical protein